MQFPINWHLDKFLGRHIYISISEKKTIFISKITSHVI